ncbi:MAG: DUF4179 domain-containing protein [Cellulosilyticaceae bacterium]
MKTIYDVLGKIEMSEEEMRMLEEEMVEVSELERARIKGAVKKQIGNRGTKRWQKNLQVAAVLGGIVIVGIGGIGVINPSYAAELPIVGDIFRFLDNGRTGAYDLYKENANEINVTKESNGIVITIKDAIFDGRTVSYTYEIKTDRDLGENPLIGLGPVFSIEGYEGGMGGSGQTKRVNEDTYVGQSSYTIHEVYEQINCKVYIKEILLPYEGGAEVVKGKWRFDFQLEAVEGAMTTLDQKVEQDGVMIQMESITFSPMSFSLDYTQQAPEAYRGEMDFVSTTLKVEDNLGNVYVDEGSSAHGSGEETKQGIMHVRTTFGKLAEGATQLVVTPTVYCGVQGGGVAIGEDGSETALEADTTKESKEIILESIVIDLKK